MGLRVVIDGNIASGKSTQFDILAKQGYSVLSERIYDWPLELFYSDPKRWALLLQFSILKSFHIHKDKAVIFERSPESSRDVFWKMFVEDETVTKEEDATYQYFWNVNGWTPDIYIYIFTPPEVCYERLRNRHQDGDSKIDLGYLQKVSLSYINYIRKKKVHIIDGTLSPEKINNKIRDIIGQCSNNVQG
jgi:deoxyadenosine/deoxycytidine kinase